MRGSATEGGSGANSRGENPLKAPSFSPNERPCWAATSRFASGFDTTIGASEVVSEPHAIPDSISPMAILAAMPMAAWRPVPQAWINVMPGVVGASLVPRTASRARFQSRECETTAPPTTSSIWTPARL